MRNLLRKWLGIDAQDERITRLINNITQIAGPSIVELIDRPDKPTDDELAQSDSTVHGRKL